MLLRLKGYSWLLWLLSWLLAIVWLRCTAHLVHGWSHLRTSHRVHLIWGYRGRSSSCGSHSLLLHSTIHHRGTHWWLLLRHIRLILWLLWISCWLLLSLWSICIDGLLDRVFYFFYRLNFAVITGASTDLLHTEANTTTAEAASNQSDDSIRIFRSRLLINWLFVIGISRIFRHVLFGSCSLWFLNGLFWAVVAASWGFVSWGFDRSNLFALGVTSDNWINLIIENLQFHAREEDLYLAWNWVENVEHIISITVCCYLFNNGDPFPFIWHHIFDPLISYSPSNFEAKIGTWFRDIVPESDPGAHSHIVLPLRTIGRLSELPPDILISLLPHSLEKGHSLFVLQRRESWCRLCKTIRSPNGSVWIVHRMGRNQLAWCCWWRRGARARGWFSVSKSPLFIFM